MGRSNGPVLGRVLARFGEASEDVVVKQLELFGEGETIRNYAAPIRLFVAQALTPRSDAVEISELDSVVRLRGCHPSTRLREEELADVQATTLFVWVEDDLIGAPDAVRSAVDRIPDRRLRSLNAGHLSWLGHPERCAELVLEPSR